MYISETSILHLQDIFGLRAANDYTPNLACQCELNKQTPISL